MKKKLAYGFGVVALVAVTAMATTYINNGGLDAKAQTGQPASMQKAASTNSMPWKNNSTTAKKTTANTANSGAMPWQNQQQNNNYGQIQPAAQQPMQQQQAQPCNDNNIVGTALGGLAGGLIGNGLGKGKGKTVATIAGAAGGALVGNQMIPTNGVACGQ